MPNSPSQPADPLPTHPPAQTSASKSPIDHLVHLDTLLETYLSNLEKYTQLRTQLSLSLRAGFFSLAQAQRASTLGSGRRYGEESYDERMKALKRVKITIEKKSQPKNQAEPNVENQRIVHDATQESRQDDDDDDDDDNDEEDEEQAPAASPTYSIHEEPLQPSSVGDSKSKRPYDPLRQFGILIPPALRQSQSSFVSVVSCTIPELINTTLEMRSLEERIEAARINLGLDVGESRQADPNVGVGGKDTDADDEIEDMKVQTDVSIENPAGREVRPNLLSKSTLASRAKEPRSRVLLLD